MRTAVWETGPQIALRDCSEEVVGEGQYMILVKGELNAIKHLTFKRFSASQEELMSPLKGFGAFLDMKRCKIEIMKISI